MSRLILSLPALLLMLLLSACSTSPNGTAAQPVSKLRTGQIEHVRTIIVKDSTGIGSIAGGVIGGILAGNHIGQGTGSAVSGVFGALLGGFLGNQLEQQINQKTAQELTIRMQDNGERLVIVQDEPQVFLLGQTVDVISNGQTARVQTPVVQK
ncbi:MAG: glycine zipper 2TM domain-containing protein [Deefgea sp.]